MAEHHKVFVAAYLILKKDDQVFLMRRANTGYEDGNYSLPGGHLEQAEQPSGVAIREAKEEIGIDALKENIQCVHVMHRVASGEGDRKRDYDDFYFICEKWTGEPSNMELNKCDDVGWFSLEKLPSNTIPFIKAGLEHIQKKEFYSEW